MADVAVAVSPRVSDTLNVSESLTFEEFLNVVDEDTHAEWVDGKIVMASPVSLAHQSEGLFLLKLVAEFVEVRNLGTVLYESFQMQTDTDMPSREPDILFVANENRNRLQNTFLSGPADLVVEIVSPESVARDRGEKFAEYERGGVREYWIIDPIRRQTDFFVRGDEGLFRAVLPDAEGVCRSVVLPGFYLRIAWLFAATKPRLLDILREWGLL